MADDIKVVADFTDLQLMRRELVGVSKDAQQSAAVFERSFNKVERQLKASATESQRWYSETLKLNKATKDASQSASVFERELAKQEARVESLAMKYKPLYASSKQYERALEEINEAHRLNILNTQQHEAAVENLNKEYTAFISGKAGWENQFVTGSSRAGKSLNKFGMYAQQVGYQVGDFFVQVQSGTNVFVAFGQQATQLAGLLPGLAGAIAGIGISIATMFLAMWDRSREASSGVKAFEDSLKAAREASKQLVEENQRLVQGLKDVSDQTFQTAADQALQRVIAAEAKLAELRQNEGGHRRRQREIDLRNAQEALDIANAELRSYRERLSMREALNRNQEIANSQVGIMAELQEDVAKALQKAGEYVQGLKDKYGEALATGLLMSDLDLEKPITLAAIAASNLAENLKVALAQQLGLISSVQYGMMEGSEGAQRLRKYGGRGTTSDKEPIFGDTGKSIFDEPSARGGAGGADQRESRLEQLLDGLMTEQEKVEEWRATQLELLQEYNDKELAIVGGQANARLRIEQEYLSQMQGMRNVQLKDAAGFFGALAGVAAAGGDKMVQAVQIFSAAQGLINSYVAFTEVLKDPSFIGRPWARVGAAVGVLGAGLNMVRAIKGVSSSSASVAPAVSSVSSSSVSRPPAPSMPETAGGAGMRPQRVIIEGINRDTLITGEQLSNIFDQLYKENEDRGFVFEVAQ